MTFAALNASVVDLRNALRSTLGEDALPDITVRPPSGDRDEASFIRLVNWSYILLYETGRIVISYLLKLPNSANISRTDTDTKRELVRSLRTWNSHNLGFDSKRDAAIARRVYKWFAVHGGIPQESENKVWSDCFEELCSEVGAIVSRCQEAVTFILSSPEDSESILSDLKNRTNRDWPAHKFDSLVVDACTRFSINLNLNQFRARRIAGWRAFLESVSEDDDPERRVIAMIERDILDYQRDLLPIDGRDIMATFGLTPGPRVGLLLERAQELFGSGVRDREDLLHSLKKC